MYNYRSLHIVQEDEIARDALRTLDNLPDSVSRTLFVVDNEDKLVGSCTDGDIRRGLLAGLEISQPIGFFMNTNFKCMKGLAGDLNIIKEYKKAQIELIPLLDEDARLLDILDLKRTKSILPVLALIMAGGRGERLKPLTDLQPKPMLKVGEKPIIEHNIDRLISYGITHIYISVSYLKEQIMNYFGDGSSKGVKISYIEETEPLGTLGALSMIDNSEFDDILVMNSDILTTIDFEDFFQFYQEHGASMALASIPYTVNIPYAVLETVDHEVSNFTEKPSYTYYSNGGIYMMKFSLKNKFQKGITFNATDLMDLLIKENKKSLVHYPLLEYWLDIGRYSDYTKAQDDIKHIKI